jgi:NAD(P)-dependent dehydrogenase (short-subunit alcohol dehydrogenase family)
MSEPSAAQRRAIVSGTSSGIGRAIAERLLHEEWRVIGFDRAKPSIVHRLFESESIDLADVEALRKLIQSVAAPDALVHAAGHMRVGALGTIDVTDGLAMWATHVGAATVLADAFAPRMREGGRIVLIGSRAALGVAERSQYAAVKAALVGLARSWAIELAPRGITVNVVAPAATDTPLLHDPQRAGSAPKRPPIGRFVKPEEVAALTAFLLSPEAAAITGQQIVICGGSSL